MSIISVNSVFKPDKGHLCGFDLTFKRLGLYFNVHLDNNCKQSVIHTLED